MRTSLFPWVTVFTFSVPLALACGSSGAGVPDASVIDAAEGDVSPPDAAPDTSSPDGASDAAGDAGPRSCTVGNVGECNVGEYCEAPTCGKGTCVKIPTEKNDLDPVCGCDDVTYWNSTVAANAGVSAKATGRCADTAKTCGGVGGQKCPKGSTCGYEFDSGGQCGILDPKGRCWGTPTKCPVSAIGPTTRECGGGGKCEGACELIKAEKMFFKDNTCPQ